MRHLVHALSAIPNATVLAHLLIWTLLLSGCSHTVTMIPHPIIYEDPRFEGLTSIPAEQRTVTTEIFYATTRAAEGPPDDRRYTNDAGDTVRLGVASVRFGDATTKWGDLMEELRLTTQVSRIAVHVEKARELGTLTTGAETGSLSDEEQRFLDAINEQLARSPRKDVTIYIHGFRVDFEESMAILGGFHHYSLRRGVFIAFNWPSRQSLWLYGADVKRASDAVPSLVQLIEFLARHAQAANINILAYSAGSTLLSQALVALRESHADMDEKELQRRFRIGNVIFAASDIDLKTFTADHLKRFIDLPRSVNVYFSKNDAALFNASLMYGLSRLGHPKAEELSRDTIEDLAQIRNIRKVYGIDVTKVEGPHEAGGMKGHGYWYANPWVNNDILALFKFQLPPAQRGLLRQPGQGQNYYFPEDYPERALRALEAIVKREGAANAR